MSLQSKSVFEFGPFRLDIAERQLTRGHEPIHLPPKSFDSLVELVKHPGHLLEKDELLNSVWPGTFVEESNLAQHISLLRKALHDGEDGVRYIETVPRSGYRFVAEVREAGGNGSAAAVAKAGVVSAANATIDSEIVQAVASEDLASPFGQQGNHHQSSHVLFSWSMGVFVAIVLLTALLMASYFKRENRAAGSGSPPITSLAVLPLQNLSGDSKQDYFADGMTEALITDLAKISEVRVISRTSAMQYKGSHLPLPEIARQLNVDAIVEGAVLQADNRVRITAQLIRGRDDKHLWADEFERDGRDVLSLQGDLARKIAQTIKLQLTPRQQAVFSNRKPLDPQAHEAYLRGRFFWNKRTVEDYQKSIFSFQEAIHKDPNYAEAYAGLADAFALLGSSGNSPLPRAEAMERARAAALTALRLDEGLAEAHTSLAFVRMHYDWKFAEAEKEFRRAIELNPSYATAHHWYAYNLAATGRLEEALNEIQLARQIDPLSVIVNTDVAEFLAYLHRYDEAVSQVHKALDLDQDFGLAHTKLVELYDEQGKYPEAFAEAKKALALVGEDSWTLKLMAQEDLRLHDRKSAKSLLDKLLKLSRKKDIAGDVAMVYAAMGENDEAFAWLEKAYQQRDGGLILFGISPAWKDLRPDPRFADFWRRIGLPT